MKVAGIIVEYNPFHYGHLYHIQEARKITNCDILIAIMSGNFTQRGEIAIIDKWERAKVAIEHGVDLVIELPFYYVNQSADYFAHGSLKILNELQIQELVFGSETNELNEFMTISKAIHNNKEEYNKLVKQYLDQGFRYPNACNQALSILLNKSITLPNDLLGYCYIKEIVEHQYPIQPISIKRTNDYHDSDINNRITSAKSIRLALKEGKDISDYTPLIIHNPVYNDAYFSLLQYILLFNNELNQIHMVDEGIENLFKKNILLANSYDEFVELCASKRYTKVRIQRTLINILLNLTTKQHNEITLDYIRVLAMNQKGKEYLSKVKKQTDLPIITSFKLKNSPMLQLELQVAKLYALAFDSDSRQEIIKKEYTNFAYILNK